MVVESAKSVEGASIGESTGDFEAFYRGSFTRLMHFLVAQGASPEEACEAVQEAMAVAFAKWHEIRTPQAFVRVAAERIFLRAKMRPQRESAALQRADWHGGRYLLSEVTFSEETQRVLQLLSVLPPQQRRVIAWTMDGYEPNEIAEMTGQKAGTVRSNLRHARARLARMMADEKANNVPREEDDNGRQRVP